ncbi:seven transmembrane MLO family protein [Actinidia rufa]|uniref:Seven transmembrane MLO family protein n=1 Tax=Actinidia rufa TaxID=165716 RepID=A0A7J0F6X7_9ERIC|nr:seven transmembrane MLO family protein [Actinidia rufa]
MDLVWGRFSDDKSVNEDEREEESKDKLLCSANVESEIVDYLRKREVEETSPVHASVRGVFLCTLPYEVSSIKMSHRSHLPSSISELLSQGPRYNLSSHPEMSHRRSYHGIAVGLWLLVELADLLVRLLRMAHIFLVVIFTLSEHIITRLAEEAAARETGDQAQPVKPSDDHFWFGKPRLVLLFDSLHSVPELIRNRILLLDLEYIRFSFLHHGETELHRPEAYHRHTAVFGSRIWVAVQVLCSYSTLPLYALVTQMGSMFKQGFFDESMQQLLDKWRERGRESHSSHSHSMTKQSFEVDHITEETTPADKRTISIIELSHPARAQESSP